MLSTSYSSPYSHLMLMTEYLMEAKRGETSRRTVLSETNSRIRTGPQAMNDADPGASSELDSLFDPSWSRGESETDYWSLKREVWHARQHNKQLKLIKDEEANQLMSEGKEEASQQPNIHSRLATYAQQSGAPDGPEASGAGRNRCGRGKERGRRETGFSAQLSAGAD
eukprot:656999-Hanusia_phi.AAC.2